MQKLVLKNQDSFNLDHIFDCGQCFRWNKCDDNSYIGVMNYGVIKVKTDGSDIVLTGNCIKDLNEVVYEYFDLETDYMSMKNKLSQIDNFVKESIEYGNGIRILKQDLWECIISFIISANNNIPRIKKIIENISRKYGKKIEFEDNSYYLFPTPAELAKASVDDLRNLGLGFRDIRVYNTTQKILNNEVDLDYIKKLHNTEKIREELLKLDGVGPKVADCIMLFSLRRFDVFPIDVWVRRVMNELYIHNQDENKVSKNEIQKLAYIKFGQFAGIVQQYLFYKRRNF